MSELTIERDGRLALPVELRQRYGLGPDTPIRVIETRGGILLVPLTDAPMSAELQDEIAQWQSLNADAITSFPYEEA